MAIGPLKRRDGGWASRQEASGGEDMGLQHYHCISGADPIKMRAGGEVPWSVRFALFRCFPMICGPPRLRTRLRRLCKARIVTHSGEMGEVHQTKGGTIASPRACRVCMRGLQGSYRATYRLPIRFCSLFRSQCERRPGATPRRWPRLIVGPGRVAAGERCSRGRGKRSRPMAAGPDDRTAEGVAAPGTGPRR